MNGLKWKIKYLDFYAPILYRKDGSRSVACTDRNSQTVYIISGLNPEFERKVIVHELVHVACFSYGIKLRIEQEEWLANFVAEYGDEIYSILDNVFGIISKIA